MSDLYIIFVSVLFLDAAAVLMLLFLAVFKKLSTRKKRMILDYFSSAVNTGVLENDKAILKKKDWKYILKEYMELKQSVSFPEKVKLDFSLLLEKWGVVNKLLKMLLKGNNYRKCYAAVCLGYIKSRKAENALMLSLLKEKSASLKLYIINSLVEQGDSAVIPSVIDCLKDVSEDMQKKIRSVVSGFGSGFLDYFEILKNRTEEEIQSLLLSYASYYPSSVFENYVLEKIGSDNIRISRMAFKTASGKYFSAINITDYLENGDLEIRKLAVESLAQIPDLKNVGCLINLLQDRSLSENAVTALSNIIKKSPQYFKIISEYFFNDISEEISEKLLDVISNRLEYVIESLFAVDKRRIDIIVKKLVYRKKVSSLINFLNKNSNREIEDEILSVLNSIDNHELKKEFEYYLDDRLIIKAGLRRKKFRDRRKENREHSRLKFLYIAVFLSVFTIPVLYIIFHYFWEGRYPFEFHFRNYTAFFSWLFAVYSVLLNFSYITVLCFSFSGVIKQARYQDLKQLSFLFRENILPSLSIIAPAFNEENTIVESINSLLNLRYPDYELIVVNDGSKDNTLKKVIDYFELEKTDIVIRASLKTMGIRALYKGKKYPELLLVDKINGGKADSLNCGINAAKGDYFVGIDSDSLLERDALLRIMGSFLDSDKEVVAAGGNIFPVNGCSVENGYISRIKLSRAHLVRFQTVEYIRSFMAGRVGWSEIALLIISGAFGVFKRNRVIDVHGYLTGSEVFEKDTVGEDMELVVRITRMLNEQGKEYNIKYVFNANCWTEVPESWKILIRQRDRWQRGLIDIMTYHFKMFFNREYGKAGLLAFPYYFFFEMMGPWFEIQGVLIFLISILSGAIKLPAISVIFAASVLLGVFVSLCSLFIAEYRTKYYSFSDKVILILYAFFENFGFRQILGLIRLKGYISSLRNVSGWGKMERKGF